MNKVQGNLCLKLIKVFHLTLLFILIVLLQFKGISGINQFFLQFNLISKKVSYKMLFTDLKKKFKIILRYSKSKLEATYFLMGGVN